MTDFWKTVTTRWQDSLNVVFGLWLILSPWALQYATIEGAFWNAIIVGMIVAAAALAALVDFHEWEEWAGMAFGLWLVASPWVLGFAGAEAVAVGSGVATWNFVVIGVLTLAFAAWSLRDMRYRGSRTA